MRRAFHFIRDNVVLGYWLYRVTATRLDGRWEVSRGWFYERRFAKGEA